MKTRILLSLLSLAFVSSKAIEEKIQTGLPVFNLESGFYKDSSLKLKIKASDRVNSLLDKLDGKVRRVMTDHFTRFGYEEYIQEGPYNHYSNQFYIFKTWLNGRHSIFMDYLAKVFNFKPAVKVTVTSDNFRKGGFTVNGGKSVFTKKYKGQYFRENVLHLTAVPVKGRTFKYWEVEDCKFSNPDFTVNRKSKLKQATVGIYPSKGCKVVSYFK